jgi:hypothetical protein
MLQRLFEEGGFAMFFLVAFGIAMLGTATAYAMRVTRVMLRLTLALAVATLSATLGGICVDLAAVGHFAPAYAQHHPESPLVQAVLQGIAESLAPGVFGFTFLAVAALIVAVGLYREPTT